MNNRINEIIDDALKNRQKSQTESVITKDYLTIELDTDFLAIQLEYLREVFDLTDTLNIVPIPFTPPYVLGIINVREEIIPVLSFPYMLGFTGDEHDYRKMMIIEEKFKIAVPFKDVIDLKSIPVQQIQDCKDVRKSSREQFINQEFTYDTNVIRIVDILKIYASEYLI